MKRTLPFVFDILYLTAAVIMIPVWMYRIFIHGYRIGQVRHRLLGIVPMPDSNSTVVWLHGAGIGEVHLLRPIIENLMVEHPNAGIMISAYTLHAFRVAKSSYPQATIFYLPFDLSWAMRRTFLTLRPALLVLSELELWPNLLLEAKRNGTPVAIVNSRINDGDFAFYRRVKWLLNPALSAIHWWGTQTERDAERIRIILGRCDARVNVTGSLKLDGVIPEGAEEIVEELRHVLGFNNEQKIFVAGSTQTPEELLLAEALLLLHDDHPQVRLVIVPRQPERSKRIATRLKKRKLPTTIRSHVQSPLQESTLVSLVDSVGELPAIWGLADFAFVGGSLSPNRGGQNMLEPALLAKPILIGPNVWNFKSSAENLVKAQGAHCVCSPQEIANRLASWITAPETAIAMGKNAQNYVNRTQGGASVTNAQLTHLIKEGSNSDQ